MPVTDSTREIEAAQVSGAGGLFPALRMADQSIIDTELGVSPFSDCQLCVDHILSFYPAAALTSLTIDCSEK